jgi:hypothetical protein
MNVSYRTIGDIIHLILTLVTLDGQLNMNFENHPAFSNGCALNIESGWSKPVASLFISEFNSGAYLDLSSLDLELSIFMIYIFNY